jgi:hypothetical protein
MNRERLMVVCGAALMVTSASISSAQPVLLQIKPHMGDTIAVKLHQKVELTATPADCPAPNPVPRRPAKEQERKGPCAASPRQMTTVLEVFSRAIVQGVSRDAAMILAVTDSIRTAVSRGGRPGSPKRVTGREGSMQLRVSRDGGAEVIDSDASEELRAIFGQMPATLSRQSVSVGEKWKREMRIPIAGEAGAMGLVRATFQLDSLGKNGDIAFISMRGTLSHDHRDGSNSEVDGWMTGNMQLDRRLAWITDTRAEIDVTSIVRPSAGAEPMRVRTRVTQLLRAGTTR